MAGALAVIPVLGAHAASSDATANALADQISKQIPFAVDDDHAADLAVALQLYAERGMQPLWVNDQGLTARGKQLAHALRNAGFDGLVPEDYGAHLIDALTASTDPADLANLDLRLSLSLMQFAADLGSGRTTPNKVDPDLFVYPQDVSKREVIREAAVAEDIGILIAGYRPHQIGYWQLKGALASYRAIAKTGGWKKIESGPLLETGMSSPRVADLRARLRRVQDLAADKDAAAKGGDPSVYDHALAEAVAAFQARHGLESDGKVGPATLAALNVPVEERIEQIVLNLERRRWMTDKVDSRYIYVNLADFHLQLYEHGDKVFETPVVIGSLFSKTPVFSADMTYLVINPYWNVPQSVATREILPLTQADPGYLPANGFELFSDWSEDAARLDPMQINWQRVEPAAFRYKLRQRPGPTNALGRVKFMMPNEWSIYLHDTPEREDFAESQRNFSHGCVRVWEPEKLAAAVLQHQEGWSFQNIMQAAETGEPHVVFLEKPLPVHITYLTAWVDDDNKLHFRNDVYGQDAALAESLFSRPDLAGTMSANRAANDRDTITQ